jgi:hypothetical protein
MAGVNQDLVQFPRLQSLSGTRDMVENSVYDGLDFQAGHCLATKDSTLGKNRIPTDEGNLHRKSQ